jgi:hypothetical protein
MPMLLPRAPDQNGSAEAAAAAGAAPAKMPRGEEQRGVPSFVLR